MSFAGASEDGVGEVAILFELNPVDPATELATPQRLSNIDFYTSDYHYRRVAVPGWSVRRGLVREAAFTGESEIDVAVLQVEAPIEADNRFDDWADYWWGGYAATVLIAQYNPNDPPAYADFEPYFTGVTRSVRKRGTNRWEVTIESNSERYQDDVEEHIYRGFGGAIELGSGDSAVSASAAALAPSVVRLDVVGRFPSSGTLTGDLGSHSSDELGLEMSAGVLQVRLGAATVEATTATFANGEQFAVSMAIDSAGQMVVYAGEHGDDLEVVATHDLGGSFAPATGSWSFTCPAELWEVVLIGGEDFTADEIAASVAYPILDAANVTGLIEAWKFGQGTGSTATGELETHDLTLTGADWVASYDGDDPEQFDGDLSGVSHGGYFGAPFNMLASLVDTQRGVYQFGCRGGRTTSEVVRARHNGTPIVQSMSVAPGALTVDVANSTITASADNMFRRFIGIGSDASVLGQKVVISKSTIGMDGTFRAGEISADGRTMELLDTDGSAVVLPSGPTGAGVEVASDSTEAVYSVESDRNAIVTGAASLLTGTITVDPIATGEEEITASELFELIAGSAPDTSKLLVDPVVAYAFGQGQSPTKKQLLDEISASCFGYWCETRAGDLVLGTYQEPAGAPVAHLHKGRRYELDSTYEVLAYGHIDASEEIEPADAVPYWKVCVGYSRTWEVLTEVPETIGEGLRHRLQNPWRTVERSNAEAKRRWPIARKADLLPTLVNNIADAQAVADQVRDLVTRRRVWVATTFAGLGPAVINQGDTVWIQDRNIGPLANGLRCVVTSTTEVPDSNLVTLVAYSEEY